MKDIIVTLVPESARTASMKASPAIKRRTAEYVNIISSVTDTCSGLSTNYQTDILVRAVSIFEKQQHDAFFVMLPVACAQWTKDILIRTVNLSWQVYAVTRVSLVTMLL